MTNAQCITNVMCIISPIVIISVGRTQQQQSSDQEQGAGRINHQYSVSMEFILGSRYNEMVPGDPRIYWKIIFILSSSLVLKLWYFNFNL